MACSASARVDTSKGQPARNRRTGQRPGLDLVPDVEAPRTDRGAPVLVHYPHRQAVQVRQRVGDGVDVKGGHDGHDYGRQDQGDPYRPDSQHLAGPDRHARVWRPAATGREGVGAPSAHAGACDGQASASRRRAEAGSSGSRPTAPPDSTAHAWPAAGSAAGHEVAQGFRTAGMSRGPSRAPQPAAPHTSP
jgi:hypothetical protein